ncbi:sucrose phosphorylase [Tepiditoga spiralis]|uniref:Sucrose phosphorylase n=1 Tax=Tepiditoga spiralis TaxID=2108365 RepID=A0A7G1G257_9BACT|nr:sugar phosphorylase [Tepiditoga spiralis]BBE30298.1 sucrose phosphorylase [Tepiditoga spiralis]
MNSIEKKLEILYPKNSKFLYENIKKLIKKYALNNIKKEKFNEKDTILITYGDSIKKENEAPLKTLYKFLNEYIKNSINTVHLLPFFPYSSDDGFSVIDYKKVNPELGNWEDIKILSENYKLMFDAVINHISAKSLWFEEFLKGNKKFENYFIEVEDSKDLSKVFRPRALPLLNEYKTSNRIKKIWTTFSKDQIDLNYKNEKVFIEILEILMLYVKNGAKLIRFDAIGFLWKEIGTNCIHHPNTHLFIQLLREILEKIGDCKIVTETNVPHQDNVSYFGNGYNEAHMVYNFTLPPLVLYSFLSQNSKYITRWAKELEYKSNETTFFNFLASHDGIGLMPVKGILNSEEIKKMVLNTLENEGLVSYKNNADGTKEPYEMNINYFDALYEKDIELEENIKKFLGAYSIAIALKGIPGIYIHSLLGSRNWNEGVKITKINRSINREKLNYDTLRLELNEENSLRHKVFYGMIKMLKIRNNNKEFSPLAEQEILEINDKVFAIKRGNFFILHNFTNESIKLNLSKYFKLGINLINDEKTKNEFKIKPYEYMWIKGEL